MAQYVERQGRSSGKGCLYYGCLTVVVIGVLVGAGIGGCVYFGWSSARSVGAAASAYLDAVGKGDFQGAYEMLSPAWKDKVTAQGFAELEAEANASRGTCEQRAQVALQEQKATGHESRAEVGFDALCGGTPTQIMVSMVRVEGRWLVDAVDYRSRTGPEAIRCPACGTLNPPGANFCSHCGKPLQPV